MFDKDFQMFSIIVAFFLDKKGTKRIEQEFVGHWIFSAFEAFLQPWGENIGAENHRGRNKRFPPPGPTSIRRGTWATAHGPARGRRDF